MSLNTQIKDHYLVFLKSEDRKSIPITEAKAKVIRAFLADRTASHFEFTDDEGRFLESIPRKIIQGVTKIPENKEDMSNWRKICYYGGRHFMHEDVSSCSCKAKFGVHHVVFMDWALKNYGVYYEHEITEGMRGEFLNLRNLATS